MKLLQVVFFFLLSIATRAMAQSMEEAAYLEVTQYSLKVDKQASYPGGQEGVMRYIVRNIRYPQQAMRAGAQGRVLVKFTVGTKGKVKNVEVLRSDNKLLCEEATRIFRGMAKWTPASLNDQPVEVAYVFPVTFRLD